MAPRRRTTRVPLQMGPDWSNLPADVVQIISEKIVFKEQYDHLRLVCRQWRRSCPPNPHHLISQFPWLVIPVYAFRFSLSLYDFSKSKIYKCDFSDDTDKIIYGHSRGWILLEDDNELSLLNPITKELKSNCLPSLAAPPNILAFARNERTVDPSHVVRDKIILTSSPSDEGCIVVAQLFDWELGFCRVGDNSWTILKLREDGSGSSILLDFKYRNGLVYAMSDKGQVTVYDLRDLSKKVLIGNLSYARSSDRLYLVFTSALVGRGDLDGAELEILATQFCL